MSNLITAIETTRSALAVVRHVLQSREMMTAELLDVLADINPAAKQLADLVEQTHQAWDELPSLADWIEYALTQRARRGDGALIAPGEFYFVTTIAGEDICCLPLERLLAHQHYAREWIHPSLMPGWPEPYLVLGPLILNEEAAERGNVRTVARPRDWYSKPEVVERTRAAGERQRASEVESRRRVPLVV